MFGLIPLAKRRPMSLISSGASRIQGDEMNRLQMFVEHSVTGGYRSKRAAYAFAPENLPPPGENLEWKTVSSFNAADEIMRDAGLKDIFIQAVEKGCAIVEEHTRPRGLEPTGCQGWATFRCQF